MTQSNAKPLLMWFGGAAVTGILIGSLILVFTGIDFSSRRSGSDEEQTEEPTESFSDFEKPAETEENEESEPVTEATPEPEVETSVSENLNCSVSLSGNIGKYSIKSFDITINGTAITGSDVWGDSPLPLNGTYDPDTHTVYITESNGDMVTGEISGILVIKEDGSASLNGTFTNYKNKTFTANLSGFVN